MSKTLQYKFNSDHLYTNPDYEVFNLTDFDKNAECKILITNRSIESQVTDVKILEPKSSSRKENHSSSADHQSDQSSSSIDNKIVELLVPINDKNFLISKIPYFKNLLKDDNLFGNKSYLEIDGQKCLIMRDQDPIVFANILKMLYTGRLDLNLDNCIEIYRILDFLNLCRDSASVADEDAGQIILGQYLANDVHDFIEKNLTKLSKIQFDKILRYNLPVKFWESIYENLDKVEEVNSLSINAIRIDAVPGNWEKFIISKREKLENFMRDYCDRKVLVRNKTHFYFHGAEITKNQTPNELSMKENDQIFITTVVHKNVRENQRNRDMAAGGLADINEPLGRNRRERERFLQMLRDLRDEENPDREPGVQVPRDDDADFFEMLRSL